MDKLNLKENLLTYIAYCLPGKYFSYEKCQKDLYQAGIETTIKSLRKEFSLAKKNGLIDFKTFYKKPYPVLSAKGRLEIKTRLPFRRYGDFDFWKIVIFYLPENLRSKRLILQKELINLGFGQLSRGVYFSPHPLFTAVKRAVRKLAVEDYVIFIKANSIEDEKAKIFKAWNLKSLNEQYEEFIQKAKIMSFERKPFWPLLAKKLEKEFVKIYAQDPHLPEKFLPVNWQGIEAYNLFKAVSNSY